MELNCQLPSCLGRRNIHRQQFLARLFANLQHQLRRFRFGARPLAHRQARGFGGLFAILVSMCCPIPPDVIHQARRSLRQKWLANYLKPTGSNLKSLAIAIVCSPTRLVLSRRRPAFAVMGLRCFLIRPKIWFLLTGFLMLDARC